ncbi:MAG: family 43 glycosylhydrolase, partial [Bacteroidales bacterium]|nr:family 43 glycosylhydrolase [Bacteroidales bacterium]
MSRLFYLFIFFILTQNNSIKGQDSEKTYCNPLNINYGMSLRGRHAADPVIVLFKDRYYLFTTWDINGYRVSDDLFNWKDLLFEDSTWQQVSCQGLITAPAVATDGNFIYFINFNAGCKDTLVNVFRTSAPETGVWEKCGNIRTIADPCLFIDNGRFYVYYGLGVSQPTQC